MIVYFIRHGETDYSLNNTKFYKGHGKNFASLTENGINQVRKTAKDKRLSSCDIILSSPYTRALYTAAILSKELNIDLNVEPELHEWVSDIRYTKLLDENILELEEYNYYNGTHPLDGKKRFWEDNLMLRNRVIKVLDKYFRYDKIIVVCHGILVHSFYNEIWLNNAEIVEYITE